MTTYRKSDVITGLDASPIVRPTAGQGGPVHHKTAFATVLGVTGDTTSYTYRMLRVPSNAIVHHLYYSLDAAVTEFDASIGLYASDANDGTLVSLWPTGAVLAVAFFAYQQILDATVTWAEITFANAGGNSVTDGFYVPSAANQPLWMAAAQGGYQATKAFGGLGAATGSTQPFYHLASDPGGFFDICATLTDTVSGAPQLSMMVEYSDTAQ